jgi:hypothetical protein
LGEISFFSGMGIDADNQYVLDPQLIDENTDPKTVDTHRFRNMNSDNNWSSCGSCHPDGLSDGVTWCFATGPRQTIPLDALYANAPGDGGIFGINQPVGAANTEHQRVTNYNAVMQSVTDFNNNKRGVQGGHGATPLAISTIDGGGGPGAVADSGLVVPGGVRFGVSNALTIEQEWVALAVRTYNRPTNLNVFAVMRGRQVFAANCQDCHAGVIWTSSRRVTTDAVNWVDPAFAAGAVNNNPVTIRQGGATTTQAFDSDANGAFDFLIVQTFPFPDGGTAPTLDLATPNPIEVRNNGAVPAGAADSFNPPSLLGPVYTPPYGHHGRAQTLADVFIPIVNGGLGHPDFGLSAQDLADVVEFIKSIDPFEPTFPERFVDLP